MVCRNMTYRSTTAEEGNSMQVAKVHRVLIEQCFTSPPTQYRLYGRRFLQVKRPNQQYQSTEKGSCKRKKPKKQRKHKLHMHKTQNWTNTAYTYNTASPLVYNYMG